MGGGTPGAAAPAAHAAAMRPASVAALLPLLAGAASQTFRFAPSGRPVLNPMRGFRHQIDGLCGNPKKPGDATGEKAVTAGLRVCADLNLTVTLGYCYLSPWWNTTLSATMLQNLRDRLAQFRAAGVSVLLNFAYEDGKEDFWSDVEPFGYERIYGHIAQLSPLLRAEADVVYGLQAGFIGNAGEWAHDIRGLLRNASGLATMVSKLLYEALPPDRHVLVRKGEEKLHMLQGTPFAHCTNSTGHVICSGVAAARGSPAPRAAPPQWQYGIVDSATAYSQLAFARLGHYNAGFMSTTGDGGTFEPSDMRSPWYALFTREAPYVVVDGECYYGTPWPAKKRLLVEGHAAAARMVEHSYNTFSHHNSYWPLDTERTNCSLCDDGRNKSINWMMKTPLNVALLRQRRLPLTDAYANYSQANNGTVYDYIRDHLGYRLELVSATANVTRYRSIILTLRLTNNGFSAPVNARSWGLALLQGGQVVSRPAADTTTDWRTLHPHIPGDPLRIAQTYTVILTAPLPALAAGAYDLGFSLLDPLSLRGGAVPAAAPAVRFTNAVGWAHGVNVVGGVTLT